MARSGAVPAPPRFPATPVVSLLALAVIWPSYQAFLGASDSTADVTTGVSMACHGTLTRGGHPGAELLPVMRSMLFDSISQVFGATGPLPLRPRTHARRGPHLHESPARLLPDSRDVVGDVRAGQGHGAGVFRAGEV